MHLLKALQYIASLIFPTPPGKYYQYPYWLQEMQKDQAFCPSQTAKKRAEFGFGLRFPGPQSPTAF